LERSHQHLIPFNSPFTSPNFQPGHTFFDAVIAKLVASNGINSANAVVICPDQGSLFVADILLWRQWQLSVAVIVVATIAWFPVDWTSLPSLTICSDVLLILITTTNITELVVSKEMVNNVAASFRVKINNLLLIAHDITIGKDFRIFFKVVACLWLLSVIGSIFSFFTLTRNPLDVYYPVIPPLAKAYNTTTSKLELVVGDIDVTTDKIGVDLGLPSIGKSFPEEEWTSEQERLVAPFKSVRSPWLQEMLHSRESIVTLLVKQGVVDAKFAKNTTRASTNLAKKREANELNKDDNAMKEKKER
ncbi:hypothetical protein HN51_032797, partial [Arachis hypogaea]